MRRLSSSYCPVSSDLAAHLDGIDRDWFGEDEDYDPELESLEQTPEGMGMIPSRIEAMVAEFYMEAA